MAKSDRSNSAKLRKETQKRAAAKYGNRPFQGTDPFSKTAATLFSVPGTIAQGFSDVASGRRKVSLGDIAGVVAPAALAAGGMAVARTGAGRRAVKKVVPVAPRIAAASRRVTARNKSALEGMRSLYREKSTEALEKRYAAKEMVKPKYVGSQTYEDRAFTDWSGGVDRAGNERTYFSRIAENLRNRGDVVRTNVQRGAFGVTEEYSQMPSFKQKTDAYSMDVDSVFADRAANRAASEVRRISSLGRDTTAASAAEIKRRLAALKRAKRNR